MKTLMTISEGLKGGEGGETYTGTIGKGKETRTISMEARRPSSPFSSAPSGFSFLFPPHHLPSFSY